MVDFIFVLVYLLSIYGVRDILTLSNPGTLPLQFVSSPFESWRVLTQAIKRPIDLKRSIRRNFPKLVVIYICLRYR
jgi:hypothetical protein